jgi:hypothetical protein
LRCGAGEGWRRSFGPVVRKMKKYYVMSKKRIIAYMRKKEKGYTGLITSDI